MNASLPALNDAPLAWVHPEIELALKAVDEALQDADWHAPGRRIGVQAHLHQVSGALHMVDLPAEQRVAEAIEAVVALHAETLPAPATIRVLRDAMAALRRHLDHRLAGDPVRDLALLPVLQAVAACQGQAVEPDALFFPDLATLPAGDPQRLGEALSGPAQTAVADSRATFQRGLLTCLRGVPAAAVADAMVAAVQRAAGLAPGRFGPRRWSLLADLLAAWSPTELAAQRALLARVDRQLRVTGTEQDQPNDALARAVLFHAALLPQPGPILREALRVARVAELLAPEPASTAALPPGSADWQDLRQILRAAGDTLETWCHQQGPGAVPAGLLEDLRDAVRLCDGLGEDAPALLLEDALRRLQQFPPAPALADADLEPVVDILATLARRASRQLASAPAEQEDLQALRVRLAPPAAPVAAPAPSLPSASAPAAAASASASASGAAVSASAPAASAPAAALPPDLVAHAVNEAVLGVFLDEADGRLRALREEVAALLAADRPEQATPAVAGLRGHLQTLRGSGLMAGLLPLAQLCRELDHVLAAWTAQGVQGWQLPGQLVLDSTLCLERWLARLASDRSRPLDALPLIARARDLRAQPALPLAPLISLQDIFLEEAGERLQDLATALGERGTALADAADARRAAHTLAGIARTAGHPGMAELAAALEERLRLWPQRDTPAASAHRSAGPQADPAQASDRLQPALAALQGMHARLQAGLPLQPAPDLARALRHDATRDNAGRLEDDGDSRRPGGPALTDGQALPAGVPPADDGLSDRPDPDLLPVFLEEAAELLPALQDALQDWLAVPGTATAADALRRTLHTLKGSARMTGCLRTGELAHQLEDGVLAALAGAAPDAEAVDQLQAGLDQLAAGIEALKGIAPAGPALVASADGISADASRAGGPAPSVAAAADAATAGATAGAGTPPDLPDAADASARQPPPAAAGTGNSQGDPAPADAGVHPDGPAPVSADSPASAATAAPEAAPAVALAAAAAARPAPGPASSAVARGYGRTDPQPAGLAGLPSPESMHEPGQAILRLKVELLDRMANAAGEAGIGRARIESEVQQIKRGLGDLVENIQRLKMQLRDIEIHGERTLPAGQPNSGDHPGFDPLEMDRYSRLQELTRSLGEGIDDVQTVQQGLKRGLDDIELALRQQGRVVRDLQQDLLRARMVPFTSLSERLQRTVRQAGRDAGRALSLQIDGAQHEIDRAILERLAAPLEHLLRNAAVHAIEEEALRLAQGKPATGRLRVTLTPGDHEVQVRVSDDGRGIDLARVRDCAEAAGLLGQDGRAPAGDPPPRELLQLIFRPGFSTADNITRLAGRGVGLDVVRSEVLGLGGRIHVDTRPGQGTEFTLVIPVTLATVQAVVVRAGDAWYAIPAPLVEQIRAVSREEFAALYHERAALWQGLRYPLASLRRVLGHAVGETEAPGSRQLLFLRSADRRCALYVDELTGTQEIVVKAVSPHLARLPGIAGASVLGNGRIVLILNPVPLAVGQDGAMTADLQARAPLQGLPCVLVVDDSLTVRRVTTRLLERAGYQVVQAKDGVEALALLAGSVPDAVLLDVEMPRMDGFELVRRIRSDHRLSHLPLVVISSRTAQRHRQHAAELGVQGYMGKPFREEELLGLLTTLVPLPS